MRPISGEPVTTGTASVAPQMSASVIRPDTSATSAARTIHGIHAAAARWFHRSTSERKGPDATHPVAATAAPGRERPRGRPGGDTPKAGKRKGATTKHGYNVHGTRTRGGHGNGEKTRLLG